MAALYMGAIFHCLTILGAEEEAIMAELNGRC